MHKTFVSEFFTVTYDPDTKEMTDLFVNTGTCFRDTDLNIFSGIEDIKTINCTVCIQGDAEPDFDSLILPKGVVDVIDIDGIATLGPREVVWPDNATCIPDYLFDSCGLLHISNIDHVTSIGKYAFSNSWLCDFTIPKGLKEIPDSCFENAAQLRRVDGLERVNKIGKRAFTYCQHLDNVNLSPDLKEIGEECFMSCVRLKNISGYDNVTSIGERAFSLTDIPSFRWPDGCAHIEEGTFLGCENLKEVTNLNHVVSIGKSAFRESGIKRIDLSNSVCSTIGDSAFFASDLEELVLGYYTNVNPDGLGGVRIIK